MNPPDDLKPRFRWTAFSYTGVALGLAAITLLAGLLRWYACLDDFWLDEIWSLNHAVSVSSPLHILTRIHHDNNHILNTAYMYVLGDQDYWPVYRLPALITGTLTVVLAALLTLSRDRVEAISAALLVGFSYLFVFYSSEARGYAPAVFFALLGYWTIGRFLERKSWLAAGLFSLAAVCGFLSHLTFVHFYVGALVWSIYGLLRQRLGLGRTLVYGLSCHALPILFFALLYYVDIRHIAVGGGPLRPWAAVLSQAVAVTLGAPTTGPLAHVANLAAGLLVLTGLLLLAHAGSGRWLFFANVLLISPALMFLVARPEFLHMRYFLVSLCFFLLLLAHLLARCWRRGAVGKLLYVSILVAVGIGNAGHMARFRHGGRGEYLAALRYMAAQTAGPVIEIGGDSEFRNKTLIDFYQRHLPADKEVRYYRPEEWPPGGPEWHIIHRQQPEYQPKTELETFYGIHYVLAREFRYSGLSGYSWFIYRLKSGRPGGA
ncbi:MAG: glycosyltransferase family 39 protein [Phycisphaerales bacterium]|nr:MAG: glycosyltransferase family 39 protein [Phycisphaerales bacterium]